MILLPGSFRANVVVATVLATLIAATALGVTHYRIHRNRNESDLRQLLSLSASQSAMRVADWLQTRRDTAKSIADSVTLIEELRRIAQLTQQDDDYFLGLYRLKRELDQNALINPFIHEITIHDPKTGHVILASIGEDVEVSSVEVDDRGVTEAREESWVSPIFPSDIPLPDESEICADDVPCMFIAAPIRDGVDLFGVLRLRVGVLDINDQLLRAATYADTYASSDAYVVNDEGVLLSRSYFDDQLKAAGRINSRSTLELKVTDPDSDELTHSFQQSRELLESDSTSASIELNGYVGLRGQKVVGAWSKVSDTNWVCIAEIDQAEAFGPLTKLARTTLYLSLGIVALVVGFATWLATQIVAPLKDLSGVAAQLAAGDRSVRCEMSRTDEIGSLANAFDNLADHVQETLNDLESHAEQLATSNQQLESELTERHRAEQELRDTNAFLDSVIDNIPTMLFMKDADDLRIVRFNKAGLELVGYPRETLIGKTDFDLYPKDEAEFFMRKDREVLNGMKMVEIEEEELLTKNGVRILHTKKIPVCDADGKPRLLLGISEDITDRKQTLEALHAAKDAAEAANRTKSDFLANMSHEIRTPMNAIIGMTELVLDTHLGSSQRDYLTIVAESAESLLSIINQILDFSKIEAGKLELETADFDVRDEVGDTVKSLGLRAHSKNLELVWQVHSSVPTWLSGDSIRLRQVLVNLIGNAIKFTEEGEVFVAVECEPATDLGIPLHVSVTDTGVGIPEDKLDHIFSAFEQADTSTTREFGGTGLGLAITASIAKAMNGRVWVESVVGEGSTFHFLGIFAKGTEIHEPMEFPDLTGLPILVVDDNATNRRILEEMLSSWGLSVESVEGGPQAIDVLKQAAANGSPPIVISDVNMPIMDGFMMAEQLRSVAETRETAIIMLTSGGRAGDVKRSEDLGVSAHLMKPVKQSELLEAIVVAVQGQSSRPQSEPFVVDSRESLPPLKILLAEDGRANQIMAVGLLTKWGHTVEIAENGERAVQQWQAGTFDVILMDVQMPVMDGLEATQRIRELELDTDNHIPIVAMTARAMKGDRERCLEVGMDDYVSKPVRKQELYRALSRLVNGSTSTLPTSEDEHSLETSLDSSDSTGFDRDAALKLAVGDQKLLDVLLQTSIEENQQLVQQLDEAIAANDPATAGRLAHTVKGTARIIAATRIEKAAEAIEVAAANNDIQTLRQQMPRLHEALRSLVDAVSNDAGSGEL